jgi:D-alanine-D-alanine ligase
MKIPFRSIDVRPNFINELQSRRIEFCYLALHGSFGEDGGIQAILDLMNIPYTGSGTLGSALAMDKGLSKIRFSKAGVPTPRWTTIKKSDFSKSPTRALKPALNLLKAGPIFIKPIDQGSAIGASRARNTVEVKKVLENCFRVTGEAMVEEYIEGREFTVGILGGKALPVVEIVPKHAFYDFHSKYAKGGSAHLVPAPISKPFAQTVQSLALRAFRSVNCGVYGRVDFLLKKNGQWQALEVNTIPGMTSTSLLPDAARSMGMSFDALVLKIAELSLLERKRGR